MGDLVSMTELNEIEHLSNWGHRIMYFSILGAEPHPETEAC